MRILLRAMFHAVLIMLLLNIAALIVAQRQVPVLKGVLSWIQWQAFSLFSLSCALVLNRHRFLLFGITAVILLAHLHRPFPEILPIFAASTIGAILGRALQAVFFETQSPAPPIQQGGPYAQHAAPHPPDQPR